MRKEHPILYSTPMVQAIDEGRKTKTRRVVRKVPNRTVDTAIMSNDKGEVQFGFSNNTNICLMEGEWIKCPYGKPGDLLWVKQTFQVQQVNEIFKDEWMNHVCIDFVATKGDNIHIDKYRQWFWLKKSETPKVIRRKHPENIFNSPGIFLPKLCSRTWLEITDIKVERLQDITPDDALEEGVEYWNVDREAFEGGELVADYKNYMWRDDENYEDYFFPTYANPIDSFKSLWQSINGRESWDANPWVWVIEFKKTKKPTNARQPD